jgi:DNA-binding NarL/FixJ family response regulator
VSGANNEGNGTPTKVLVVDDHSVTRHGVVLLCENAEGVEVIGEASDGNEAIARVAELLPDVVLMDLSMPVLNGLDATRLLREVAPGTAVVVFSAFDSPELKRQAFDAGAVAYLPKGASAARLRATVEAAVTFAGGRSGRA